MRRPSPARVASFYMETFTKGVNLDPGEQGAQDLGMPGFYNDNHDHYPANTLDMGQVDNNPGSAKVIPSGHGFANKVAARMGEILNGIDPEIEGRSHGIVVTGKRFEPGNLFYSFNVPGSKGETYVVKMKMSLSQKNITDANKADLKLSCSCPFWRWQGPEHWAKSGDYLYGKPVGLASRPNVRDPDGKNRVCKHVLAVMGLVTKWKLRGNR